MSVPFGLKERFGRLVTELGRSRPPHQPKATKVRRSRTKSGAATEADALADAQRAQRELAENNRQKSGGGGDTSFGPADPKKRGLQAERPPSRLAAKASEQPCCEAKEY